MSSLPKHGATNQILPNVQQSSKKISKASKTELRKSRASVGPQNERSPTVLCAVCVSIQSVVFLNKSYAVLRQHAVFVVGKERVEIRGVCQNRGVFLSFFATTRCRCLVEFLSLYERC